MGTGLGVSVSALNLEEEQGAYLPLDLAQPNLGLGEGFTYMGGLRADRVGGPESVLFSQGDRAKAAYEVLIGTATNIQFRSTVTEGRPIVEKEIVPYQ